jgi:hypothetical protein
MPQVTTEYPDLSQMFGAQSAMPAILGMERFRQAQQAQQGNMADQAQQMQIAKDRAPVDLAHIASQTSEANARVPFIQAQTQGLNLTNEVTAGIPKEERIAAHRTKMAKEMGNDQLDAQEAQLNKIMLNPHITPEARQQVRALLDEMPKIRAEKLKLASQEAIHKYDSDTRAQASRDVAGINKDRALEVQRLKNEAAQKGNAILNAAKAGKLDPAHALGSLSVLAAFEKDPEIQATYQSVADQMDVWIKQKEREKAAAVPQVAPDKVPGAPLTTPVPPVATPRVMPKAASAPSPDLQKAVTTSGWAWEPDKYDYRIGPDGKVQRKPKGK